MIVKSEMNGGVHGFTPHVLLLDVSVCYLVFDTCIYCHLPFLSLMQSSLLQFHESQHALHITISP